MRVLLLNYEFPPLGGGAGNATYYLLKEFAKLKIDIDLITSSVDRERDEQFSDTININYLDIGKAGNAHYQSLSDLWRYTRLAKKKARELIENKSYNVVHAFFGIPGGYIARQLKLPYIVSLRGSDVPNYNKRFKVLDALVFRRLSKSIWKDASHVIANSNGLRQLALETSPHQEIGVVYNGVDTNTFKPKDKASATFTILSTSRLIKRKGLMYLLEAFKLFNKQNPQSQLLLAGDGNLRHKLETYVHQSDLTSNVSFLGVVKHEDLPKLYPQADVFVLPSLNEGMSNSVLEAMASGLPIITTNTGGTSELVKENGYVVPSAHAEQIYEALEDLYNDKTKRHDMALASRKKAEQLTWRAAANQYYNLYKSIR